MFFFFPPFIRKIDDNFIIPNDRDIDFKNLDAEIGFAIPVNYENSGYNEDYSPLIKGYGAGIDFGIVYTKLKSTVTYDREDRLCARPYNDYKYKIGFSILDFGAVVFKENAELHKFENVSKNWIDFDTIQYLGIHHALENYSRGFFNGDPNGSYSGDKIRIGMPATVSLQFDYHLRQRIYIAALWMHPFRFNARTVWRPAQIAVIPRYEDRFFGVF